MELSLHVKRLLFKLCFLLLCNSILLLFSVFSYGLLYYLYIPAVAHVKSVHLRYDASCSKAGFCSFPYDNITLVKTGRSKLLSCGQAYAIEIILDMPESERNMNQGMFMIQLDMLSKRGDLVKSSKRPALLRYRSPLFKVIYTLFFVPALLLGTVEEKQSLSVPLFEEFVDSCHNPTHFIFVEVQAQTAEVYTSILRIHAQFTGLRYMMYYWPILSAVVGIGSIFFFVAIIAVFMWVRQIMNTPRLVLRNLNEKEQALVREIRQSVAKGRKETSSKRVPSQNVGITRRRADSAADSRQENIENLSPYGGIRRSEPQRSPEGNTTATQSDSSQPLPSDRGGTTHDDQINQMDELNNDQTSEPPHAQSPSLRRRTMIET